MATLLDRANPGGMDSVPSGRKSGTIGYTLHRAAVGASNGAALGDYPRFGDIRLPADPVGSVRLETARLEIRSRIGQRAGFQQ
jgi:hypothetical protein